MLDGRREGASDDAPLAAFGVRVERSLVVAARDGVRHPYEGIVDALIGPLVAAAEAAGADRLTALDVAAETLVRGWQSLPTLRAVDGFGAYLDAHLRDVLAGRHGRAADTGASEVRQLRHVVFRRLASTQQQSGF